MKTNAIVRIVIYSLIILLLLSILGVGLGIGMFAFDMGFDGRDMIEGSEGSVPAAQVRKLNIEWVDGSIDIKTADTDTIRFRESGYTDEDKQMVWKQTGDTLTIRFSKSAFQIGFVSIPSKDLEIVVPQSWVCDELDIETVSGDVRVNGITANDLELDCTSAECEFSLCTAKEVSLTTVSGDLIYSGSFDSLRCDGVSAKCNVTPTSPASEIQMDCVSGDLILNLSPSMGFSATLDSVSGKISTEFDTTNRGDQYIYGNGSCHIEADSVSGNIIIKKTDTETLPTIPMF